MRADVARGRFAATLRHLLLCRGHLRARGGLPRARDPRVRRHDRHRCDTATQRVPFRVLHPCRLPRAARRRRTDLVGSDDGAGRNQGLSRHRGAPPALLRPVLARPRHHLGLAVHGRLSDGSPSMTDTPYDRAPGDRPILADREEGTPAGVLVYTIGLILAVILTITSFWVANTSLLWPP